MSAQPANHVTVTVSGDTITCEPDPVPARGKDVHIHFDLRATGYVFTEANAIIVDKPGTQFPEASRTHSGGMKVTLLDKNTERGLFKYTVRLTETATGRVVELDPGIQNEE